MAEKGGDIVGETKMWFKSNKVTKGMIDTLIKDYEISDRAYAFTIHVNLKDGDVTCYVHHPCNIKL